MASGNPSLPTGAPSYYVVASVAPGKEITGPEYTDETSVGAGVTRQIVGAVVYPALLQLSPSHQRHA